MTAILSSYRTNTGSGADRPFFLSSNNTSERLSYVPIPNSDYTLWDSTLTSAVPMTSGIEWASILVKVEFQTSIPYPSETQIYPTNLPDGFTYANEMLSWEMADPKNPYGNITGLTFQVKLISGQSQTPWCINQAITWDLYLGAPEPLPVSGGGMLEIYGIPEQPEYFQTDGIPIELLRLFIPTSLIGVVQNEQQWIEWVTNVCHGKQDPKGTPLQLRQDSTSHWFRYNVWDGQPSFTNEWGGRFGLIDWLNGYTNFVADPTSEMRLVNCFDQAGIVQIALGLGLAFSRLHWEAVAPFGYINNDLTGWGPTNSPFFEGDSQYIKFSDLADPMRTPFRSHVFITISPATMTTYDKTGSMVVDACAGPICGDKLYPAYINDDNLQTGIHLLQLGHNLVPLLKGQINYPGVTSTVPKNPGSFLTLDEKLSAWYPGKPTELNTVLDQVQADFSTSPPLAVGFSALSTINGILGPILDNAGPGLVFDPTPDIGPIIDTTDNGAGIVAGAATTHVRVAAMIKDGNPTYISFKISSYTGGVGAAVTALRERLGCFTLPSGWEEGDVINVKSVDVGTTPKPVVFGTQHFDIFVYKNLLVEVAGNAGSISTYRPGWTTALWTKLAAY